MSVFAPTRWSIRVPPMLRSDGQPDLTAHHVLLVLATYARADGTGARPSLRQLAASCYSDVLTVERALDRIQAAGLISKAADLNGTVVWRLHLEVVHEGPTVTDQRIERRRAATAERTRRWRERQAARTVGDAVADRHVTQSDSVTEPVDNPVDNCDVTQWESVTSRSGTASRDAAEVRHVTQQGASRDAPQASHPQVRPPVKAIEQPIEQPEELFPTPAARASDFDQFWATYPRKVGKTAARKAWDKATRATDPAAILAGAKRYRRQRDNQDPRYTAHPATWLNAGRWDDEDTPPLRVVSGGYRPWTNPIDDSVYDEELL